MSETHEVHETPANQAPLFTGSHPAVPRVLCPRCGTHMRLAEIMTDIHDRESLRFDCSCDFEYQMSSRIYERAR